MSTKQICIIDPDTDYVEWIAAYARTATVNGACSVRCFTEPAAAANVLKNRNEERTVLLNEKWKEWGENNLQEDYWILTESGGAAEPFYLYKYQPLDKLFSAIVSRSLERRNRPSSDKPRSVKVISIYSAVGQCGKTTTALNLARGLAMQDKRVFYLNLELLGPTVIPSAAPETQPFEEVLYYIRTQPAVVRNKLEQAVIREPSLRFDYLPPAESLSELQEMTASDTSSLIKAISECGYDSVIVDLESSAHPRALGALSESDSVWWIVTDEAACITKTRLLLDRWRGLDTEAAAVLNAVYFIQNKCRGNASHGLSASGHNLSGQLPYIPQWKAASSSESLFHSEAFNRQLMHLAASLEIAHRGDEVAE